MFGCQYDIAGMNKCQNVEQTNHIMVEDHSGHGNNVKLYIHGFNGRQSVEHGAADIEAIRQIRIEEWSRV